MRPSARIASPGAARLARAANGTPWPGAKSIGGTIRNGCS